MADLLQTYCSFLPALLVRGQATPLSPTAAPIAERAPAVVLFADISGSSELAERFAERGPEGAEALSRLLNRYFERLIAIVTAHGGDIVEFAGDALLACWNAPPAEESLSIPARRAAQCGLCVQAELHSYKVAEGLRLSLRVGLGAGSVLLASVGGVRGRWEFVMAGPPLVQMGLAQRQAAAGEVVVSPEAWELLQEHCGGSPKADGFVRLDELIAPLPPTAAKPVSPSAGQEAMLRCYIPRAVVPRLDAGQSAWLAELRTATALFVRLKGLDYSGPQALDRLQAALGSVQQTLYRHGGSISRFSVDDKGTILLAAFGLHGSTYKDNAVRAGRAALRMRSALAQLGVGCDIGVATGRVFCGCMGSAARREYTMIGTTVNLAAGLMQVAEDDVLCNAATYEAAQGQVPFLTLPQFVLKGRADPLPVYRPLGETMATASLPLMVGRAEAAAKLTRQLAALEQGESGVVFVEGEAGIGKSRLVDDFLQQAASHHVSILQGQGDAIETAMPFHAWRAVFSQLFRLDGLRGTQAQRERVGQWFENEPELARQAPLLNAVLPLDLPENEFTRKLRDTEQVRSDNTNELLVHLLQKEADRSPLLLVFEDAHWLDSVSRTLVRLVARRVQPALVVLVTRPREGISQTAYHQLREELGAERLELTPLSRIDTQRLISQSLGVCELQEELAESIYLRAGGNPFYSQELAYALRDAGQIVVEGGVCRVRAGGLDVGASVLPDSIEAAIVSRIDRLTPRQQMALKVASAIGQVFPYALLRDIYPIDADKAHLRSDLDVLAQLDLTPVEDSAPELTYRFKHAIMQEAAYGLATFEGRREWHRAIAEWYERTYADDLSPYYPLLVHHWGRANDEAKTITFLAKAGEQALRTFANREAVARFTEALARQARSGRVVTPAQRSDWQLHLGEAYVNWGKHEEGQRPLEEGLRLGGERVPSTEGGHVAGILGQLLLHLSHRVWSGRDGRRSAAQRDEWLKKSRAWERLTEVHYFAEEVAPALFAALRSLNLAEAAGPSPELARGYASLGALGGFIPLRGLAEGYFARARQQVDMLREMGSAGQQAASAFVSLAAGFYSAGVGNWAEAAKDIDRVIEISEQLGDRRRRDDGRSNLLYIHYFRGEFGAGVQVADQLIQSAIRREDELTQAAGLQGKAMCLLALGKAEDALACLTASEALLKDGRPVEVKALRTELLGGLSITHLRQSARLQATHELAARRHAELAFKTARQLAELTAVSRPSNYSALPAYAHPAEVFLTLWEEQYPEAGLPDWAGKACRSLRGYAKVFPIGRPRALLWQGLCDWLSGKPTRARAAWADSLAAATELDMPYDEALVHYEMGRRADAGDPARQQHLSQARRILDRLGVDVGAW